MTYKPKKLIYDIEVSPALGWFYPPVYKTNILRVEGYQILMSVSWGWDGEFDEDGELIVHHVNLSSFKTRYKNNKLDDYDVAKQLHKILCEADIVIGQNNRRFDDKMANTYFLKHNLGPVSPYKTVDTYSAAKGSFRFLANGLDAISKERGRSGKTDTRIGQLWYSCLMEGSKESWKLLEEYNDQDVKATYQLYEDEKPYIKSHPNMGVYMQQTGVCATCGESQYLQSRGTAPRVTGEVKQWWCNKLKGGCGSWNYERLVEYKLDKEDRPDIVSA